MADANNSTKNRRSIRAKKKLRGKKLHGTRNAFMEILGFVALGASAAFVMKPDLVGRAFGETVTSETPIAIELPVESDRPQESLIVDRTVGSFGISNWSD